MFNLQTKRAIYLTKTPFQLKCNLHDHLRYQGTPNDNIAFSPFERQAFHKDPSKLYIF